MKQIRGGFTIIELLVVTAIISVLVAVLLPAVEYAREAARRSNCKSNLHQLGIALHNYHEQAGTLPSGWVSGNLLGWMSFLLPMLEQANVYNNLNFSNVWMSDASDPLVLSKVLRCPSDAGTPTIPSLNASRSNYPGVSGATAISSATVFVATGTSPTKGSFGENSKRPFTDFLDGLSNTFLVGERKSPLPGNSNGGDTLWVGLTNDTSQQGQAYVIGDCSSANVPNKGSLSGFSSVHTGGAHLLLGDGSVKLVNDSIDVPTYRLLATINGGNALGTY